MVQVLTKQLQSATSLWSQEPMSLLASFSTSTEIKTWVSTAHFSNNRALVTLPKKDATPTLIIPKTSLMRRWWTSDSAAVWTSFAGLCKNAMLSGITSSRVWSSGTQTYMNVAASLSCLIASENSKMNTVMKRRAAIILMRLHCSNGWVLERRRIVSNDD